MNLDGARRRRRGAQGAGVLAAALALVGCTGPFVAAPVCTPTSGLIPLPPEARESSGVEGVAGDAQAFWTHNDSGWDAVLFAVDREGRLLGEVEVEGARNRDWEDLAAGPCPEEGGGARCLYIADTGDNRLVRTDPAVYRVVEPVPGRDERVRARRFPIRLPHGPRDMEALYVLPGERLFFVTKGRAGPVELYRYPGRLQEGVPVELERIQTLTRTPRAFPSLVTGAASHPQGKWVAVRTYQTLTFFRPDEEGRLEEVPGGQVNLRPLNEPQGEAVAFLPDGELILTTEAGPGGRVGGMAFLRCAPPG